MPVMSGVDLAWLLHREMQPNPPQTILLTPFSLRGAMGAPSDVGVSAILTKPVRDGQLLRAIAALSLGDAAASDSLIRLSDGAGSGTAAAGARPAARILVAEDNIVNQKVALRFLGKMGYQADVASNGTEALEAALLVNYDLILMDCQMPGMDGIETTRELRRREDAGRRTPIIAMTANAMQGDRERCLECGMDDYLSKPVKPENLAAILERWLRPAVRP
jgi:CheY-like chemotaxis protein